MSRNVAPVIAAEVLLERGVREDTVFAYLASMWRLNDVDGRATRFRRTSFTLRALHS
jgi:hypothetical protein